MKLGVQLYTLRSEFERDVPGTLEAIAALGLRRVELAGHYGLSARELRSLLDMSGLESCGTHVGLDALQGQMGDIVADARVLGHRFVVLPWVSKDAYAEGWSAFGKSLERFGRQLADEGLVFAYHNHAFEFADAVEPSGLEALLAASDPSLVRAELDVGWIRHAGRDPAGLLRAHAGRVPLVHLKDFTADPNNLDIEAGHGIVDWESVLPACDEAGVEYGIIELDDPPHSPIESVRMCLEFFLSKGLAA